MDTTEVGIFTFVTAKGNYECVVKVRLDADGVCQLEGNEIMCRRLHDDGVIVLGKRFKPEDGKWFLKALPEVFRNPYLKAVPMKDETAA